MVFGMLGFGIIQKQTNQGCRYIWHRNLLENYQTINEEKQCLHLINAGCRKFSQNVQNWNSFCESEL